MIAQYIDKDAVVAEFNRLIAELIEEGEGTMFEQGRISAFEDAKLFLDTLEVKEVELGKESLTWEDMLTIHRCIKDAMNYHLYAFQTVEGQQKMYEDVLRRFKAQKG